MTDNTSPGPLAEGGPWAMYAGDARAVLASMPEWSANCIVTSPPYWGKRDYGVPGQYGHEDTPAAYTETVRAVFREARRVLADDGTCWLNLGDSYSASGGGATGLHAYLGEHITTHRAAGMHAKNLLGLPWRVAFALQEDGWLLRNAVIWHKPNAMPSRSATGSPAGTNSCSCWPSSPGTGSTWTRSASPAQVPALHPGVPLPVRDQPRLVPRLLVTLIDQRPRR
jgi:hypothetical protein